MNTTNTTIGETVVARAQAFAQRHRPAPVEKLKPRTMTEEDVVRRLADDMLDIAAASDNATENDLLARGWPLATLNRFGGKARDRANVARLRRVA